MAAPQRKLVVQTQRAADALLLVPAVVLNCAVAVALAPALAAALALIPAPVAAAQRVLARLVLRPVGVPACE